MLLALPLSMLLMLPRFADIRKKERPLLCPTISWVALVRLKEGNELMYYCYYYYLLLFMSLMEVIFSWMSMANDGLYTKYCTIGRRPPSSFQIILFHLNILHNNIVQGRVDLEQSHRAPARSVVCVF